MSDIVLLMPFLDESDSFCNGFETGKMWHRCSVGENIDQQLVRNDNIDQLKLLFDHHGYKYEITETDESWSEVTAAPIDISSVSPRKESEKERPWKLIKEKPDKQKGYEVVFGLAPTKTKPMGGRKVWHAWWNGKEFDAPHPVIYWRELAEPPLY